MRLYLDTSHESNWAQGQWRKIASTWHDEGHIRLADSEDDADAILITLADCRSGYPETVASIARAGPYARHPDKTFVFDTQDSPMGLLPGLYCSLRSYLFSSSRHRTGCFMQSFNEFVGPHPSDTASEFRYLFSFQGNFTSRVRGRLFQFEFGRDDVLVQKTEPFWTNTGGQEYRHFKQQYAANMLRSRFVLCPRGIGTSTFRLFETMQAGRVPVILSDAWVPPRWFDWSSCALRVAERDISRLPEICLAAMPRWERLAHQALLNWEKWFSPSGMGRLVRESIEDIRRTRHFPESVHRLGWPVRRMAVTIRQTAARAVSNFGAKLCR